MTGQPISTGGTIASALGDQEFKSNSVAEAHNKDVTSAVVKEAAPLLHMMLLSWDVKNLAPSRSSLLSRKAEIKNCMAVSAR